MSPVGEGDLNTSPGRRAWAEQHPDEATAALLAEDAELFLHQALSIPCLDVAVASRGSTLTDLAGRAILDFHGNSVHQVGYGHPRVVAAIREQLDTLPFCPRRFTNRPAIALARKLVELAPEPLGKVLFAPSGSAAIGMALRLARYATGRFKTVSMWESFHGANLDAISVGGEAIFRREVGPLLPGGEHVPPPGLAERFFGTGPEAAARLADYIDYVLAVQGDVAAVIAEPMRWTTAEPPPDGFWASVRASCDRHGALLVFDEIPSAPGRTGTMFLCEQVGAVPDILVLGKGLGGGVMPMAAILARRDLDLARDRALGHYTHEKSPLGCAAALATIEVIEAEGLLARAVAIGERMRAAAAAFGSPLVHEVRGIGAFVGIELRRDGEPAADAADRILYGCLERGLSLKVGGGNVLTLCPPLTIGWEELDRALAILGEALAEAG